MDNGNCTDPAKWGFATHVDGMKTFVVFSLIGEKRGVSEVENKFLQSALGDVIEEPVDKTFVVKDVNIGRTLAEHGFVKDHPEAVRLKDFYRDEGYLAKPVEEEDEDGDGDGDDAGGLGALQDMFNSPVDEDVDEDPKTLSEMLAEQAGVSSLKCPHCGGTNFIDPNTDLGAISSGEKQNVVFKICANCMQPVTDPELERLFGGADKTADGADEFFASEDFKVKTPDGSVGPYYVVVSQHYADLIGSDSECVETEDGATSQILTRTEDGVIAMQFDIPHRKYTNENGVVVEWNGTKRFLGLGVLKAEDDELVFNLEFLGEEQPDSGVAEPSDSLRPIPMEFGDIELRFVKLDDGTSEVEANSIIRKARMKAIVGIDLHNFISQMSAVTPGAEVWCLLECELYNKETTHIVTDGNGYYRVKEHEDGKLEVYSKHDLDVGFGPADKALIEAVVQGVTGEDDDEKDW
jgi:hypothetical protein